MCTNIELLFCEYLQRNRSLSRGTCEIYCRAIHNVDEIIQKLNISDCSIYAVKSLSKLNAIINEALHTDEITAYDKIWRKNRELSLRHYAEFAYANKRQILDGSIKQVRTRRYVV